MRKYLDILKLTFITVSVSFLFLNFDKKTSINEVKVNDFQSLSSQFQNPPAEYTTAPFFVWDAKITTDEIDRDLESFRNAGSSQVIIHPRPGLINEYLSEDWFSLFTHAVAKGKELGMKIWIYDENSYPSGFAGGHVPAEMPESYNNGTGLILTKVESLPDTAVKYFLCLKQENGSFKDITMNLTGEKGKKGKYYLFSKTYNEKSDWYGGFSYVDLIYPGVTQKFLEITMKGYEKSFAGEFGKTVSGIFTDEPQIESPGGIRWTPDLFDAFAKKWNYDLKPQLPSLFEETGDWKKVRHNYTQTLLQLFIDRWAKPYHDYCQSKNLKFTGHYWEHQWPRIQPGGDNMAMYAWSQVPAIDMLFNQFNDSTYDAQFGNIRSVKELASAANQTGRQRKLSETYGGSGWDLSFTDMKRNGDWEYALGVNLMNQHLTYFGMYGARKYDYPPTFDYHEPWWGTYKYINTHFARLSLALSSGIQSNDILILEPTTTCWLYDSYVAPGKKVNETGQSFQSFITKLEKSQVEYDLGSENIIKDLGSVVDNKLVVGQARYSRVVIPPMTENLDRPTFELLRKFVKAGGKLLLFSEPSLVDGSENNDLKNFLSSNSGSITLLNTISPELIAKYLYNNDLNFQNVSGGSLYHHRRIMQDGELIFLINSSLSDVNRGVLKISGKKALEMNTLTGEINEYPFKNDGGKISLSFNLPPAGSLLLFIPGGNTQTFPPKPAEVSYTTLKPTGPVKVQRNDDNVLTIDFCNLTLDGKEFRDLNTYDAADNVYKHFGFKNGNPWNTSVQYKRNILDRDTFSINTGFTAKYIFTTDGNFDFSGFKAVVERPNLWTVSINGQVVRPVDGKWWLDRSFAVYNIGSMIKPGENELAIKASPMTIYSEIEPVYILGNFSLKSASKGFIIEPPLNTFTATSWKEQGNPFYFSDFTYTEEFNVDNTAGRWEVAPVKWNGTVAHVRVNGQEAPVLAFPPYHSDVTSLIKQGVNKIEISVTGSLKNLLGPHHGKQQKGFVSPWSWRYVKAYPEGKDYMMNDYGLFGEFELLHGK